MIFVFRKGIKKWNKVWWLVIAGLVMGSASFFFGQQTDKDSIKVATVNGGEISLKTFHHAYAEIKSSLDDLARYWGISADKLAAAMGMKSIGERALGRCVENILVKKISDDFSLNIDQKTFQKFLGESVSRSFADRSGSINMIAYKNYLNSMNMSITDYESNREEEFKRNTVLRAVEASSYTPNYIKESIAIRQNKKKSFELLKLPFSEFLKKSKQTAISKGE